MIGYFKCPFLKMGANACLSHTTMEVSSAAEEVSCSFLR